MDDGFGSTCRHNFFEVLGNRFNRFIPRDRLELACAFGPNPPKWRLQALIGVMAENTEIILTTCPRDCYDACGIAVIKEGGVISRVRGDQNNPVNRGALCGKCAIAYNGIVRDPNERLKTPLRRVGPKGAGQFEPVSWDEAIESIAQRLN